MAGDRAGHDDVARPLRNHPRQYRVHAAKHAAHVDGDQVVPSVRIAFRSFAGNVDARISHQHIDTTEMGKGFGDHPLDLRRLGKINRQDERCRSDLASELF